MTDSADIAIVGGGMVGASLGLLLSQCLPNWRIVLCERTVTDVQPDQPLGQSGFDARSTALSPSSVSMLERLGVWQSALRGATPIRKIHVSDRGHAGRVCLDEQDNQNSPLGYVVENEALGQALTHALVSRHNLTVLAPTEVVRVRFTAAHAVLTLKEGQTAELRARLVIVADGADSQLRSRLGIDADVVDYEQCAVVANVQCAEPHRCVAYERFTSGGPLAMLPLKGVYGHTSAMVWSWPIQSRDRIAGMSESELLTRLQTVFGYRLGRFLSVGERNIYALRRVLAREQVRRRLVLMGNAAHFLHPVAGQGFNLAARDALRLTELLVRMGGDPGDLSILQRYEKEQAADQRNTAMLSHGFNQWFGNGNPLLVGLRNGAMGAVQTQSWIRNQFIRQMAGRNVPRANPWEV